jgi:transglutaminase-like putative cysteine protease
MALIASPALAEDWKPVDPAELALKAPVVEKDADAEAIFWEVRVDDNPEGDLIFNHYVRIKIFTERGREAQSKIDIIYGKIFRNNIQIKDIAGRTIKPDGQIIELKKQDIFERDIIRASGLKTKAKSFAMPGVEPGSIIEYRWREVRSNQSAQYIRLQFQRDIPVQRVKYYIKPFPFPGLGMAAQTFHSTEEVKFAKEKDGFYSTTMLNMPAHRDEPRMPPEDEVRTWTLIYYSKDDRRDPAKYWKEYGKQIYEIAKPLMKVNDEVKQATLSAVGDAATPEQKLDRIFEFCRTRIKNASNPDSGLTAEERAKLKDNKTPSDTLKRGAGSAADIDLLFAAMATAAGFDARLSLSPDRSDVFFNPSNALSYFLTPAHIAVRVGEAWRFFNPGYPYIPEGMLLWKEEGNAVLVTDPKEPAFVQTPLSGPEKSTEKRTAKLKLAEDGTLEGDVRVEYTGHLAVERKEDSAGESASEREESLRAMIKGRMSTAELSDIKVENATDPARPFVYQYHIKVPGYAQRTGKRLFLQPAFFQHGAGSLFPTSSRTHAVYFHYPWSESDEVSFELPAGFALDNADAPASFGSGSISRYDVKIMATKDQRTMIYKRNFFFGGGSTGIDNLLYPAASYTPLKAYFDMVSKQDSHTITLKQGTATAAN